ncbi:MAG TPA: cytochrome c oxidase subunit 3 family protein [Polyangiaceae bacterium]
MSESTSEAPVQKPASHAPHAAGHDHGDGHGHGGGHGHEAHDPIHAANPHLAHHFDTPLQQFEAGKLGIWLFLLTEVLFFAGLFVAYTIYRAMRPEVFVYAHYFLDTKLGALNTCVLLGSSLTAAWAVRNAQLKETSKLILNIVITIACACTFMVVKYFEYSHKAHDGLLWGPNFNPKEQVWETHSFKSKHPEAAEYAARLVKQANEKKDAPAALPPGTPVGTTQIAPLPKPTEAQIGPLIQAGVLGEKAEVRDVPSRPRNAHVFFSIYFFMTGLHGLHVTVGIGIFVWLLMKARRGVFGPNYFGPIDYAALYWHLVDLIWIYLFPLLYLIH